MLRLIAHWPVSFKSGKCNHHMFGCKLHTSTLLTASKATPNKFLHSKQDLRKTAYMTPLLACSCERGPVPKQQLGGSHGISPQRHLQLSKCQLTARCSYPQGLLINATHFQSCSQRYHVSQFGQSGDDWALVGSKSGLPFAFRCPCSI